ncbi:MAG: ribosome biogenesis GTPase Der, partial [Bacteroidota bacterium]
DMVAESLPEEPEEEENPLPKFAIVGQPNVGKSSLTNALLGMERNIVTDIAGTTRDSIHSHYSKFDKEFILVDTAGIRKKSKVHENLEFYSVMRAIKAIEDADVCLLMIDAQTGVEAQDMAILRIAQRRNKGIVILVNKWDLVEKETNTARDHEKEIRNKIAPFNDVPVVFVSALNKQRIFKGIEAALEVYENRSRKIKTSVLNEVMQEAIESYKPPAYRGKFIKIKYITQLPTYYPAFAFFCNHPKYIKEGYRNYLENQLRKNFNFTGVPIGIFFRKK